jgi:Neprosin
VQTNANWHFGYGFNHYSTQGGTQYEFTAEYYLYEGNWWLALGGTWVGYYPGTIYRGGQMTRNAQVIEYGGETVGTRIWPPMGSDRWANAGWRYAANQRNVFYIDINSVTWWANLTPMQPSPACYSTAGPFFSTQPGWGIYFFFGGPGGRGC